MNTVGWQEGSKIRRQNKTTSYVFCFFFKSYDSFEFNSSFFNFWGWQGAPLNFYFESSSGISVVPRLVLVLYIGTVLPKMSEEI